MYSREFHRATTMCFLMITKAFQWLNIPHHLHNFLPTKLDKVKITFKVHTVTVWECKVKIHFHIEEVYDSEQF